jgi:hypothetical protein
MWISCTGIDNNQLVRKAEVIKQCNERTLPLFNLFIGVISFVVLVEI